MLSTATSSLRPLQYPSSLARYACPFSTTTPSQTIQHDTEAVDRPRWQQTPPRMVAPFRVRPKPRGPEFKVNADPRKLDDAFVRMLGPGGDKVLSDDVKWLAVTHKSFDHARRGFNDRLAFLGVYRRSLLASYNWNVCKLTSAPGRRIVSLQTSQALINAPQPESQLKDSNGLPQRDQFGRVPFTHPSLSGLSHLTHETKDQVLDKLRLSELAARYGLDKVTRWKPKRVCWLPPSTSFRKDSLLKVVWVILADK